MKAPVIALLVVVPLVAVAAADDGLFALDDLVASRLEAWRGVPSKEAVTVRQLLQLESGIDADWRPVRKDTHDDKFAAAVEAACLVGSEEK